MHCDHCDTDFESEQKCPHCQPEIATPNGRPTLIKGVEFPFHRTAGASHARKSLALAPLVWMGAMMIAIPWMLANHEANSLSDMNVASVSPPPSVVAASPAPDAAEDAPDHISLVIHLPANRKVDTGLDMCGCTHLKIHVSGNWVTPLGDRVGADGIRATDEESAQRGDSRDRGVPYGALIGRVGSDSPVVIGHDTQLAGEQFNSIGTLRLGMNAGRIRTMKNVQGELTITITGSGSIDHAPTFSSEAL